MSAEHPLNECWLQFALNHIGITREEFGELLKRIPALAGESERITREVPGGQAHTWAWVSAIEWAQDAARIAPMTAPKREWH
jgi:hypothetical protein